MRPRIALGKSLIRTGRFIQSLAVVVMRPRDLIEFTRQTYSEPEDIQSWSKKNLVDLGLNPDEKDLLKRLPVQAGRLLILGVGGGREAIELAKRGFEVTGIDFVSAMVDNAVNNAFKRGVEIKGSVQDINALNLPARSFDVIWVSSGIYSSIPTKKKRIVLLKKLGAALREGGYLVCIFYKGTDHKPSPGGGAIRRIVQFLTLGNFWYERGDMLLANIEFIHAFSSEDEIRNEFVQGGCEVLYLSFAPEKGRGTALLEPTSFGDAGKGAGDKQAQIRFNP